MILTLCKPTNNMSVESGGKTRYIVVKGYICLHKLSKLVTGLQSDYLCTKMDFDRQKHPSTGHFLPE